MKTSTRFFHFPRLARAVSVLSITAATVFAATDASAEQYPAQAIRIVVPVSAGGGADTVARLIGENLAKELGQPVVIENRGGAGGNIATSHVANAAPDGYSILFTGNNHTVNVSLYPNAPYQLSDFRPLIHLSSGPSVFSAAKNAPFDSLQGVVEKAKADPGGVVMGNPGVGLPSHIAGVMFERAAGIELLHVPYKGSGPALTDALGGQIPMVVSTLTAASPYIKAGHLKPLAVTSKERWAALPDIPTAAEQGYPDYVHLTWFGLLVPAGTPDPVVVILNKAVNKVLQLPTVQARLQELGTQVIGGDTESFQSMLEADYQSSKALVEQARLKPE